MAGGCFPAGSLEESAQQRRGLVLVVQARADQDRVRGFDRCCEDGGRRRAPDRARRRFRQPEHARFGQRDRQLHGHGFRHGQGEPSGAGAQAATPASSAAPGVIRAPPMTSTDPRSSLPEPPPGSGQARSSVGVTGSGGPDSRLDPGTALAWVDIGISGVLGHGDSLAHQVVGHVEALQLPWPRAVGPDEAAHGGIEDGGRGGDVQQLRSVSPSRM